MWRMELADGAVDSILARQYWRSAGKMVDGAGQAIRNGTPRGWQGCSADTYFACLGLLLTLPQRSPGATALWQRKNANPTQTK